MIFMKIIFLDFNGILDTNENMNIINNDNLSRLKRIVESTGAKVVISSSIKTGYVLYGRMNILLKELINRLFDEDIEVVGYTKVLGNREEEIIEYLGSHPEIDDYVILDDDYEMPKLNEHLVKLPMQGSEGQQGLRDSDVEKAMNILGISKECKLPTLK